ncbi:hypothetical protein QBZ16_002171 [Prototheca wickerhamii]|uniref:Arf-GAP domain-containing protein n=1 Tax=Prototheca wickerhamii TaxID=3111 RepID=A0AAD9IJW4_PROWI|nr:hypothetical protein QBZ16_002171 [Prototheca wickerhamii]
MACVHKSFVRSTTLDSWTEEQLAIMAVGGNGRARAFFKQHGWDDSGTDKIEAKYSSRAAQLYKRQLEKDASKFLDTQHDAEGNGVGSPTAKDDPWSEDYRPKKHTEAREAPGAAAPAAAKPKAAVKLAARPAGAGATARPAAARRPAGGALKAGGRLGGGLGIKKVAKAVDDSLFDQAPAEPEEEAPEAAGAAAAAEDDFDAAPKPRSSRFDMDAMEERVNPSSVQRGADGHLTLGASDDFFADPFGSAARPAPGSPVVRARRRRRSAAQDRFGGAKAISSAAFFNQDNSENDYEKQARLAKFSSAGAISSDAYFGRETASSPGGGSSGLEISASDLVSKISLTAKQDISQLKSMATVAGSKLSSLAQGFMRDLQGGY